MDKAAQVVLVLLALACDTGKEGKKEEELFASSVLFRDDFEEGFDALDWLVEMDDLPGSTVAVQSGKLVLDTRGGVTVWFRKPLEGDFEISYKRKVVVDGGDNDRLSDLNQFWMATDPSIVGMFQRSGKFEEYDSLSMYYVGFGGNYNSTTRFRKYEGYGIKPVIAEYDTLPYLLEANREYLIQTVVNAGKISFLVDGELFFEFQDESPLPQGYFGFRSTWSRQEIDDFMIKKLED